MHLNTCVCLKVVELAVWLFVFTHTQDIVSLQVYLLM